MERHHFSELTDPHSLNRLAAAKDIANTERGLSAIHGREGFSDASLAGLSAEEGLARLALHRAFADAVEHDVRPEDALPILELFIENNAASNATLARLEMKGDWDAASVVQNQILHMFTTLHERGYESVQLLAPNKKEQPDISILAGFTPVDGLVALRRKRRLIIADSIDDDPERKHLEIDKVSTFALDINALDELNDQAAREVRLIIASSILQLVDMSFFKQDDVDQLMTPQPLNQDDHKRLHNTLRHMRELKRISSQYQISFDDLMDRSFSPFPHHIHHHDSIMFIERAIKERSRLLTPASTTYYVHS